MLNTSFFNKTKYMRKKILDFFILLDRTSPTHLGLGQTGPAMNSGDTPYSSRCRTVESSPNEGEGEGEGQFTLHFSRCKTVESSPNEGEGEAQRGSDGLRDDGNAGGRSLSTVQFAEQWRATQTKEKGKGKSSAVMMD
jgi:hypothetical protein